MVGLFILNRRIIVLIGIFSMKMKLLVIMIPMVGNDKGDAETGNGNLWPDEVVLLFADLKLFRRI